MPLSKYHRIADARLENTDSHGRRRDVDPTLLYVDPVRGGDPLFGRPKSCLDPHGAHRTRGRRQPRADGGHANTALDLDAQQPRRISSSAVLAGASDPTRMASMLRT